jgi:hypothetical protein
MKRLFGRQTSIEPVPVDSDRTPDPSREVEFALVVSKMISAAQSDARQMRLVVYDFAYHRLLQHSTGVSPEQQKAALKAFETAIQGVENFHSRREGLVPLDVASARPLSDDTLPQIDFPEPPPAHPSNTSKRRTIASDFRPKPTRRLDVILSTLVGAAVIAMIAFSPLGLWAPGPAKPPPQAEASAASMSPPVAAAPANETFNAAFQAASQGIAWPAPPPASGSNAPAPTQAPQQQPPSSSGASQTASPTPVPTSYGVYAVSDNKLWRLNALPDYIPDKKIAISTPLSRPETTALPNGRVKIVIYSRDMAVSPPDQLDVRVFAQVKRRTSFDPKGKPIISPVSGLWSLRNITIDYRPAPVSGNTEIREFNAASAQGLSAGRYVVVLDGRGYEFSVAGAVTDKSQCLEQLDASNGSFYSECQKSEG